MIHVRYVNVIHDLWVFSKLPYGAKVNDSIFAIIRQICFLTNIHTYVYVLYTWMLMNTYIQSI